MEVGSPETEVDNPEMTAGKHETYVSNFEIAFESPETIVGNPKMMSESLQRLFTSDEISFEIREPIKNYFGVGLRVAAWL